MDQKSPTEVVLEKALKFMLKETEGIFIEIEGQKLVLIKKEGELVYFDGSNNKDFVDGALCWMVDA